MATNIEITNFLYYDGFSVCVMPLCLYLSNLNREPVLKMR